MNIHYEPSHEKTIFIKLDYEELVNLRYMLTISYDKLMEDLIYSKGESRVPASRCEQNLELRELISMVVDKHNAYMDEQEKKYE